MREEGDVCLVTTDMSCCQQEPTHHCKAIFSSYVSTRDVTDSVMAVVSTALWCVSTLLRE